MKKNKYILWLLVILILIAVGILLTLLLHRDEDENLIAPVPGQRNSGLQEAVNPVKPTKAVPNFNISQLSASEWNTPLGLPYSQVPGANLGPTSFVIMDESRIAFLCNSTSEIIITNKSTGKSIEKFKVTFAPRDFVYDKGNFYVLYENKVIAYDEKGSEIAKYQIPGEYQGVEKLMRNHDATYLLLPSGNSLLIENSGTPVNPVEYNGVITGTGQFITTRITGNNTYAIKVLYSKNRTFEKTFTTDKKVAGIFVTGATDDRIILDVQTFISENPVSVKRAIASVEMNKNGLGSFVNSSEVPDCYYVISNRDFYVTDNGNIYNMMTTPEGVFVFSLTETKSDKTPGYPSSIAETKYHSNDNLIKLN